MNPAGATLSSGSVLRVGPALGRARTLTRVEHRQAPGPPRLPRQLHRAAHAARFRQAQRQSPPAQTLQPPAATRGLHLSADQPATQPRLQNLLRPQTSRGQPPRASRPRTRPPPRQRHVGAASRPPPIRTDPKQDPVCSTLTNGLSITCRRHAAQRLRPERGATVRDVLLSMHGGILSMQWCVWSFRPAGRSQVCSLFCSPADLDRESWLTSTSMALYGIAAALPVSSRRVRRIPSTLLVATTQDIGAVIAVQGSRGCGRVIDDGSRAS